MSRKLEDIEGIGPQTGASIRAAGIKTVEGLLEPGADKKGRTLLAEKTGIAEARILKFVNHADLFRIKGVAGQYAELLEGAGVGTVKELRGRNAENLAAKMIEVNMSKKLVRIVPSLRVVAGWIAQAKQLQGKVNY